MLNKIYKIGLLVGGTLAVGGCTLMGLFLAGINTGHIQRSLVITTLTLWMSIMTLMIIRQQTDQEVYWSIKTIALGQGVKAVVVLCYMYMVAMHYPVQYSEFMVWVQSQIIDVQVLIFIISIIRLKKVEMASSYLMITTYILGCMLCLSFDKEVTKTISRVINIGGIFIFSIYIMLSIKGKIKSENKGYTSLLLKSYYSLLVYQYGVFIGVGQHIGSYYIFYYTLTALQGAIVLWIAYETNIKTPWEKKMIKILSVKEQLDKQDKTCERIVNLSHELKTPVNVVKSALTILDMDFKEKITLVEIKNIKNDCQHVMNIIQDMIDIQKIRGSCIELHPATYNWVELVENVVDAFAYEMYGEAVIFDTLCEEIYAQVDQEMCQQGFMILLGLLLQETDEEVLNISMSEEKNKISVLLEGRGVKALKEQVDDLQKEEEIDRASDVEKVLGVQLMQVIMMLLGGTIETGEKESIYWMLIKFPRYEEKEKSWLDEDNLQVMREKIRCRYKVE